LTASLELGSPIYLKCLDKIMCIKKRMKLLLPAVNSFKASSSGEFFHDATPSLCASDSRLQDFSFERSRSLTKMRSVLNIGI
jgi:hypothetical protein